MRKNITFQSIGTKCAAWYFQPEGEGPFPVIVMAHGLAAIKNMRLDAYAEKFAEAGFACFVFDYRYFGESEGEPRQLLDIKSQHQDWKAAVEFASALPRIDSTKVILWGTSLSGGHVITMAASLPKVFAVISQVPHLSGLAALRMNSVKKIITLSAHGLYDKLRALCGLTPHYLLASSEPDALGLMNASGESKGYLNLVPNKESFDQRVSARFALDIASYSPIKHLKQLQIPVLIQVATHDLTTPPKPVMKLRGMGMNVQLKTYATGHFQPYVEPMFSIFISDQIKFISQVVGNN